MSRSFRTAALIIGAAALIATGVGAAAGAGLIGASAGSAAAAAGAATSASIAATAATVASAASAAGAALSLAAVATAPKGTVGGNATKFKIDKEAGIPIVFGRTYAGGNVIHRQYYDDPGSRMRNQRESWVTVLSLGPVKSIGPLLIDKAPVSFNALGAAIGSYAGNMWLDTQLGACPEARALQGPNGDFPGWYSTSKLSGLAADLWTLDFDSKGKKFPNGVPERGRIVEGVFAWDPRLDSTYPGGSGSCRRDDPATHVYSECPWIIGLTFALGYFQNGYLMAGGGTKVSGIDVATIVAAANVCDANGWKAGGQVYASADNSWDILQMLAQAGGGEFLNVGGMLTCTYSAPRVSIGTITSADVAGTIDAPSASSRRKRRNTFIPSVRLESHNWEVAPLDAVKIDEYIAADGAPRPKADVFPLVQNATHGAQLALYWLFDQREIDGIVIPAKIYACGYRPGDCITLDIPEANLIDRDVVIRTGELDMASMGVTFTCRTETAGKHAYALSQTGNPPPTPDLSNATPDLSAPSTADWSVAGATLANNGVSIPAIVATGEAPRGNVEAVLFEARVYVAGQDADAGWFGGGLEGPAVRRKEFTGVTPGTQYEVGIRYRVRGLASDRLILGPVTTGSFGTARAAYLIIRQTVAYPVNSDDTTISIQAFDATIDDGRTLNLPAQTIGGLTPASTYMVLWDLQAEQFVAVSSPALTEAGSTRYVIIREWTTANADGTFPSTPTPPAGDGGGGYGGGGCPIITARILLANATRTGPGSTIEAGRIEAGMWVWAQREAEAGSAAWGAYQVTMARTFPSPLCAVAGRPLTSPSHLWWDRGWVRSETIGQPAGDGKVVALTVAAAATYVLIGDDGHWWLSHNKRADANEL
ncbi:hypothetical protein ASE70_15085 [Sphingomonas sp. Leaf22]|uniref:hypothetical protein n=1 Tax=Sphingomonas sp. Leaf22 TaxID=1735687 RepID=UPI000700F8BA|nr:hypothetical protein [Sphingomonas sp. Leaf22]KQM92236.1 hypothetical protein ASE70_15085 [Sphingomonas sp. Leaf22]